MNDPLNASTAIRYGHASVDHATRHRQDQGNRGSVTTDGHGRSGGLRRTKAGHAHRTVLSGIGPSSILNDFLLALDPCLSKVLAHLLQLTQAVCIL